MKQGAYICCSFLVPLIGIFFQLFGWTGAIYIGILVLSYLLHNGQHALI